MLKAVNLTKQFGNHMALHPLNLEIKPGEIYCLLGSNGAGKSTTINLFLGFIHATSGSAYINDVKVSVNNQATREMVAYIPEVVNLYPTLTGMENLEFFSGLSGYRYTKAELGSFMEKAGLQTSAFHKRVGSYSKGMRQKVGIAIALVKKAKALFLDEPTSGLDPHASSEFSQIITRLSEQGVSTLMATHDLLMAKNLGNRIGIMHQGELKQELPSADISHAELTKIYIDLVKQTA